MAFSRLTRNKSKTANASAERRGCNVVCLNRSFGIGTNDLSDLCYHPKLFAQDLCSYAEYLQIGFGIQKIIIG